MNELRLKLSLEAIQLLFSGEEIAVELEETNLRVTLVLTDGAFETVRDRIEKSMLMHLDAGPMTH